METLQMNGKINLIEYPVSGMDVTEKPRKPMHSYLYFIKDNRAPMKLKHPQLTFKDLSQMLGDKWKQLSKYQKAEYELLAAEDKRINDI